MNRFDIGRSHCLYSRITFSRNLDPCWSEQRVVTMMWPVDLGTSL